ncbi:MAG: adenylate/guanylate cyclase domain-containing protein [Thermoplasmata archaeon]|nr:adenylate/guanylate cyclase domain-containing protein [Thermoplasmata archaeon]
MAPTRRLAAIMFTDMVGSTSSAQTNEAEALRAQEEQTELLRPLFAAHQGREVKSMGDGFLAEFDSALRAVECAIAIQSRIMERNSQETVTPFHLRIGIHLGDVEERGGDIFGDSVNIAARIEPLADPDGICISEPVFGQVRNKISHRLEKLELQTLKNVRFPLEIYRIVVPQTGPSVAVAAERPTRLAVLPFANISPNPNDDFFADGLTEELITVLSQLEGLRVIARTSVMQYKATPKAVSQIARELGVSSILEGSVRKAGNRLRITAQLIDASSQDHVWANTYDRELDDIFAVQTEIAQQVAGALRLRLQSANEGRLRSRPPVTADSYLAYLKGRALLGLDGREPLEGAKAQFERAISLDPNNAVAHSGLADAIRYLGWYHSGVPRAEWDAAGRRSAARAIELAPHLAEAHASLGLILWDDADYAGAEREFKTALELNPSYSQAHSGYGLLLEELGQGDLALVEFRLAEASDPLWTHNLYHLALLLIWLGQLDEALLTIRRLAKLVPNGTGPHSLMARWYAAQSNLEGTLAELQLVEQNGEEPRHKSRTRSLFCIQSGDTEEARRLLRIEEALPPEPQTAYELAYQYAELGDLDESFRCMELAYQRRVLPMMAFRLDPRLEHVRKDPRFREVLKKVKLG